MQYVPLGKITDKISRFGLGCMRLPSYVDENGKKQYDDEKSAELIRHAIDKGVNYFDTAYAYGRSEEVVGKALKGGYREKVIISTKIPMGEVSSHEDLYRVFEEQLTRLQTDYIDVYHLHNMNKNSWAKVQEFKALDFLRDLKKQGKIRHCAFSMHERAEFLEEVVNAFDEWDLVMIQYNYLDKFNQCGRKGVEFLASKGIPMVAMEPLHGGLLAQDVPENIVNAFGDFYPEMNQAEKSFMWLYNQPEVSVILSGSSSMEQLEDSLAIFEKAKPNVLSPDDEKIYDNVRAEWLKLVKVPCTGCNYCIPCPSKVFIPEVFRMYNETAMNKNAQKWLYSSILANAGEDASKCVGCGVCETKCPQSIEIINELKLAHEALTGRA